MPRQYQQRTGPITNDQAPFSIEMVQGARPPEKSRQRFGAQSGRPLNVIFDEAMPDFFAGRVSGRPRLFIAPPTFGAPLVQLPLPFDYETIRGYQPTSPRLFLGPRIPLPLSQTTHTPIDSAFPDQWLGTHPDRSRAFIARPTFGFVPIDVAVPFSFESTAGNQPSRPRLFLAPRIPLPFSQTTHIPAPFSQEMVAGNQPSRPRLSRGRAINDPFWVFVLELITNQPIEHSRPDRPRLWRAPRSPQLLQTIFIPPLPNAIVPPVCLETAMSSSTTLVTTVALAPSPATTVSAVTTLTVTTFQC